MASWLILAAGLAAAAVLASTAMQTTISSLADEVAVAAGVDGSTQRIGEPGQPSVPGQPADLGAPPSFENDELTVTSRQRVIDGEEFLILEVADQDGNVEELEPIQLTTSDSDSDGDTNIVAGGADVQVATRPADALDDYTIDDYVADQAARGNEMNPISIGAAQAELDLIKDTFANSDPDIRDRVLEDVRERGTAGVAHMAGAGAEAMPQDHYEDNLLGLIADTLFGWTRNRRTTPPPALPIDRGTEAPSDSDYTPTPSDTDGDGIPNLIDNDFNPTPEDTDGDGIPNLIDRDTQPVDPIDLLNPQPEAPTRPPRTDSNRNTDGDTENERGSTSNPGNPNNPAGEPDECHGSCA